MNLSKISLGFANSFSKLKYQCVLFRCSSKAFRDVALGIRSYVGNFPLYLRDIQSRHSSEHDEAKESGKRPNTQALLMYSIY